MEHDWLLEGAVKDAQSVNAGWEDVTQELIDGVKVREVKNLPTGYGHLHELFRADWQLDDGRIEQVFQATLAPGRISAWHAHQRTVDRLFVNRGMIQIVLYDARKGSPTYGTINEFRYGELRPAMVTVPPKVWHGIRNVGNGPSSIINIVDIAYVYNDPDHWRLPPDSPEIPYRLD